MLTMQISRIQNKMTENIYLRNLSLKNTSVNELHGYGIRVFKNGAWGFAHNNVFTKEEIVKTVEKAVALAENSAKMKNGAGLTLASERSYIDTYTTPVDIDPFSISLPEKVDLMMEVNRSMLNYKEIQQVIFLIGSVKEQKHFASTLGTRLCINNTYISPHLAASAVANNDSQRRALQTGSVARGWEFINSLNLLETAPGIGPKMQ